ncbi:MAG: hypothetical protein IPL61_27700 [Myxococcales bacterium]|nr:hypothetical protein [Myxococcales bacterium]
MSELEKALGRPLDPAQRSSVALLTSLARVQLGEAAALARRSKLMAVDYLQFHVQHSDLDASAQFIDEVLLGGADVATWGIRDVLLVATPPADAALVGGAAGYLGAIVSACSSAAWVRIEPGLGEWMHDTCGAPGPLVRNVNYTWTPPDGLEACWLSDEVIETVSEPAIGWRRWLAGRVAWQCKDRASGASTFDAAKVQALASSPISDDGRIALRGLLQEVALPATGRAPGFRGPDDWYRDLAR